MKKQNYLRFAAILIAVLVITIPVSYAQSLKIIQNSGQDNVQDGDAGFIKAADDVWTLAVEAENTGQVIAGRQLKVNGFRFDYCTPKTNGTGYTCVYEFDYRGARTLVETQYNVGIDLYDVNEQQVIATEQTTVTTDGSAPEIVDGSLKVYQGANQIVRVEMDVGDRPDYCAGIGKIEVYDSEAPSPVLSLEGPPLDAQLPSRCGVNSLSLNANFIPSTNLTKTAKVIVYDRLGHKTIKTANFIFDFNLPSALPQSLTFGEFSNYIPGGSRVLDVYLNISEDSDNLTFVQASSSTLGWNNEEADECIKDHENDIFTCVWKDKSVQLSSPVFMDLTISDGANTINQEISKNFLVDPNAPEIDFFGAGLFEGVYYINPDNNEIKAVFQEDESGMNPKDVKVDFTEVNPLKQPRRKADRCEQSGSKYTCYWEDIDDAATGTIYLVEALDRVGNEADTAAAEAIVKLVVDDVDPVITDIKATAAATGEPVSFFQKDDVLTVTFYVSEEHGVAGEIEVSDILNTPIDDPIEATCIEDQENIYKCQASTPPIKGGYDPDAEIKIIAYDSAKNKVEETHKIEILGVADDVVPDFWHVQGIARSPENGIDITTVPYVPQRVFYTLNLKKNVPNAVMLGVSLENCVGDTDKLTNTFMVNNMFGSSQPYLVLETAPHTPDKNLELNCTINVFSRSGQNVITTPEQENIHVTLPFFQTKFDSEQNRLDRVIKDQEDRVEGGLFKTINILNKIITVLRTLCSVLKLYPWIKVATQLLGSSSDPLRSYPATYPTAVTICIGKSEVEDDSGITLYEGLKKFCKIMSCSEGILSAVGLDMGLDKLSNDMSSYTTDAKITSPSYRKFQKQAKLNPDPYSNIFVALIKLCVPAIVYNLEKLRQIECRYYGCLKNEARTGVTTIEGCRQLRDYQRCAYFLGDFFAAIPGVSLINGLIHFFQNILKDPIGLLGLIVAIPCKGECPASGAITNFCSLAAWTLALVELVNDIIAEVNQYRFIRSDYCTQVHLN